MKIKRGGCALTGEADKTRGELSGIVVHLTFKQINATLGSGDVSFTWYAFVSFFQLQTISAGKGQMV